MKISKKQKQWQDEIAVDKKLSLSDAIEISKKWASTKFDESIDLVARLGIDTKKSDQVVRGSCSLPHGTGKTQRVLVLAKGEKVNEAKEAGADYYGGTELVEKIKDGWLDFERVVATPDMMGEVGKIGKILGPKGLMPNPKLGTVTLNIANIVQEIKKGSVQFRADSGSNVHVSFGKISFESNKLIDNFNTIIDTILKLKPPTAKGTYLKSLKISSTMGPSLVVDESNY